MHSAAQFIPKLVERGKIPLMSWHQIEELLQHEDENLVDMRLSLVFLRQRRLDFAGRGTCAVRNFACRLR